MTATQLARARAIEHGIIPPAFTSREIHIVWAPPVSGYTPRATKADPLRVNDPAIFSAMFGRYTLAGKTLMLGDGEFLVNLTTTEDAQLPWQGDFSLVGAGRETILKVNPSTIAPPNGTNMLGTPYFGCARNVLIENLIFDSNAHNVNRADSNGIPIALGGLGLSGDGIWINNCVTRNIAGHLVGWSPQDAQREAFGITIQPAFGRPENLFGEGETAVDAYANSMTQCVAESPKGNYENGLCIFGSYPRTGAVNQAVRSDCTVRDWTSINKINGLSYMNPAPVVHGVCRDLRTYNCDRGMRLEGGTDLLMTGARFYRCREQGLVIDPSGAAAKNMVFRDMIIEMVVDDGIAFDRNAIALYARDNYLRNITCDNVELRTLSMGGSANTGTLTGITVGFSTTGLGLRFLNMTVPTELDNCTGIPADALMWMNRQPNNSPLTTLPNRTTI